MSEKNNSLIIKYFGSVPMKKKKGFSSQCMIEFVLIQTWIERPWRRVTLH